MAQAGMILLVLVAVAGLARLLYGKHPLLQTVYEWEHGLLYQSGRFVRETVPGRYWTGALVGRDIVTIRRTDQVETLPLQDVTSAEGLAFRVLASLTYRVVDARTAHEGEHVAALRREGANALAVELAKRPLEQALRERADVNHALTERLGARICGCEIVAVSLLSIVLPPEIRRMFSEVERAKADAMAALERARGEQAALRSLANSARMLKGNPELQNLRLLQALALPGRQKTIVLGQGALAPLGAGPDDPGTE